MKDFDFILFGSTGDLAMRKIFPSLYEAFKNGFLNKNGKIIATSRSKLNKKEFTDNLNKKSKIHIKDCDERLWEEFIQTIDYVSINLNSLDDFFHLKNEIKKESKNIVIYFSISSEFFIKACSNLALVGLNDSRAKIILEKPLGMDLQSCKDINNKILNYYKEEQIYRIDHYLGKESVQNILFLRAFNPLFKASWNKEHIKYVEISIFETLGVESRGEFYDNTGALRDMVQNHILQILSLLTMRIPNELNSSSIRKSKLDILKTLKPLSNEDINNNVIRAQYSKGGFVKSYLEEDNIKENSKTETFVAFKTEFLDENWLGVPFYIRTGKRMHKTFGEIVIYFCNDDNSKSNENKLIIKLQPNNEIILNIKVKKVGDGNLYEEQFFNINLDSNLTMQPYERLILDAIEGNQTLFNHKEELETAWKWVDPILKTWSLNKVPLYYYEALSLGPKESFYLINNDGFEWNSK